MRIKRLLSNIGIYFLGTFSTKILQFLFIPLYTIYISTNDFGYYNLTISIISLTLPLLYQSIWEGILRFAIENEGNEYKVLSTTNLYVLGLSLIYISIFIVATFFLNIPYGFYILFMGLSHMAVSYWQFSARALKKNKEYAISTIIYSIINIFLNLFLIIVLNWGLIAIFISNIIANMVMILYLEYNCKILLQSNNFELDKELLKSIIKYSWPLAINATSWWLITSSSSLIITTHLDFSANGIYSIANRFGSIMTIVTSVINLAWLEEAFRTFKDEDKDQYFNNVLDLLTRVILSGVIILIPITYIVYQYFVFGDYKEGVILTPIFYLSAAFSAIASHLGSGFLAYKKSKLVFKTTLIGGIVSVLGSFIFIKYFGLIVVAAFTFIGFVIMYIVRIPLLKKIMNLKINYLVTIGMTLLCILIIILSHLNPDSLYYQLIILFTSIILVVLINRKYISLIYRQIKLKFNNVK